MSTRSHKTSLNTEAAFAVIPGMVASTPQTRVYVIKHPVAILWRTGEQRERE